jgi:hypothetical protein
LAAALDVAPAAMLEFEEERASGTGAAGAFAAAESVSRYLAHRPAGEIERALRILEAALGAATDVK